MVRQFVFLFLVLSLFAFSVSAQESSGGEALVSTRFSNDDLEEIMANADLEALEELHAQGFDFNEKDSAGNPSLFYLLTKNPNLEVVRKAIEYGADVNMPAANGMIPLNFVTSKANEMQLQIMMFKTLGLDVSNPEVQEQLKANLYHEMSRMIAMAEMLIENGADVNRESSLGMPLTNAVTNAWNQDIVELLIKAGADLNWQDKEGRSALFYAAAGGNDEIVMLLLKAGADPNLKDLNGNTYLDVEPVKIDSVL